MMRTYKKSKIQKKRSWKNKIRWIVILLALLVFGAAECLGRSVVLGFQPMPVIDMRILFDRPVTVCLIKSFTGFDEIGKPFTPRASGRRTYYFSVPMGQGQRFVLSEISDPNSAWMDRIEHPPVYTSFQYDLMDFMGTEKGAGIGIEGEFDFIGIELTLLDGSKKYYSHGICPWIGDLNYDGIVDLADYAVLAEHWMDRAVLEGTEKIEDRRQ